MRLGCNIPNLGPDNNPDAMLAWLQFAEETGFDVATISDHVALTDEVAAVYPNPFFEPFTLIAWLAAQTTTIRLATSVTVLPYRDPHLTANMAAALNQLSHGRFILGTGIGWARSEFEVLNTGFEDRGRTTDAALEKIRSLWTREHNADGDRSAAEPSVHPTPTYHPAGPPIWIGGASVQALERVARYGDAWHPINAEIGWMRDTAIPVLAQHSARLGRPHPPRLNPRIRTRLTDRATAHRGVGEGTLDEIIDDLTQLAQLGSDCVVLDTNPDHPNDRRTTDHDWDVLQRVAQRAASAGLTERTECALTGSSVSRVSDRARYAKGTTCKRM